MEKFSSKIYSYGRKKVEARSYELDRHIGHFKSFLQTPLINHHVIFNNITNLLIRYVNKLLYK